VDGRLPRLTNSFTTLSGGDILKLLDSYKGIATMHVQDGKSCFFWLDLWNGRVLQQVYLELFSFAKNAHM